MAEINADRILDDEKEAVNRDVQNIGDSDAWGAVTALASTKEEELFDVENSYF